MDTQILRAPVSTVATEVAAGIVRAEIPVPGPLRHANAWLLREAGGWSVVDCGSDWEAGRDAWAHLRSEIMAGLPVRSLIVTHGHHDHIGYAAPLAEAFGLTVHATLAEWQAARLRHSGLDGSSATGDFYRRHGCDDVTASAFMAARAGGRAFMSHLPDAIVRLRAGDSLELGGISWEIRIGGGHAPESAMLYAAEAGLLIAGDQLLPKITPFVGLDPLQPFGDPLGDYLDSLAMLAALPDDVLVLPGHGPAFVNPAARARETRAHHMRRLDQIEQLSDRPLTGMECARRVFPRAMDGAHARLALCELLAHANHLVRTGRLHRETGADGLIRFVRG